jgi:hypothetical protein
VLIFKSISGLVESVVSVAPGVSKEPSVPPPHQVGGLMSLRNVGTKYQTTGCLKPAKRSVTLLNEIFNPSTCTACLFVSGFV